MTCRLSEVTSSNRHALIAQGPHIIIRPNSSNSIMNADLGATTEITSYIDIATNLKGSENYRLDCTKSDNLWSCIACVTIAVSVK